MENGARPVQFLGSGLLGPFDRLGALVFQPYATEISYWAGGEERQDPDSRKCSGQTADTGKRDVFPDCWQVGIGSEPQCSGCGEVEFNALDQIENDSTKRKRLDRNPARLNHSTWAETALRLHSCRALSSGLRENFS